MALTLAPAAQLVSPRSEATDATDIGHLRRLRSWSSAAGGHGLWIAAWSLVGWAGTLAAPALLDHPFVLMLLAPRALFVALAANSVGLVAFVLLGTARLAVTDASYFIVGRRLPSLRQPRQPATTRLARARALGFRFADRCCAWLCSHGFKAGTVLFFRPNGKYLAVAGAYGVRASVAGWSSIGGTAIYLACFHLGLGLIP